MSTLFKRPRIVQAITQAPPPPPVPTFDDAADREEFSRKLRRRRSHQANSTGAQAGASVAARTLLG